MSRSDVPESGLLSRLREAMSGFLSAARGRVLSPWRRGGAPDPAGVYEAKGAWVGEVDSFIPYLVDAARIGWADVSTIPYVSTNQFVVASLATSRNYMVGVPDTVADLVFAELAEGVGAGEGVDELAARVGRVLSDTDTDRWPARERVIARTELTRAYTAGVMGSATLRQAATHRPLRKRWDTRVDGRERATHHDVNGVSVPLGGVFMVGGWPMMGPGDELASPDEVCGCRCSLTIVEA